MNDGHSTVKNVDTTFRRLLFISTLLILLLAACSKTSPNQSPPATGGTLETLAVTALPDSGGADDLAPANNADDLSALRFSSSTTDANVYGWSWDETTANLANNRRTCIFFDADEPPAGTDIVGVCSNRQNSGNISLGIPFVCNGFNNGICSTAPSTTRISVSTCTSGSTAAAIGGDADTDTTATCTIAPNNAGQTGGNIIIKLSPLNVCSKAAADPLGASLDCVLNTAPGLLKLVKVVNGGTAIPSNFNLTYTGPQSGTVPGATAAQAQFFPLISGTYTLTESLASGYAQQSLACVNSNTNAAITLTGASSNQLALASGTRVTCTFTNAKIPSIKVIEDTVPNSPQDFAFATTGANGLPATFSLDDDADVTLPNQQTFNVVVGNYTIAQTTVTGWTPTATCSGDNGTASNAADDRVMLPSAINVLAGEAVTCTFTNTRNGSITIIKDAVPNSAQDFAFTTTGAGLSGFSLDDDADATLSNTQTFNNLMPGSYSVTETAVPSWIQSLSCVDPDNGTTTTSAVATIDLDSAENIVCTYINTFQPTSLTLVKQVTNDNGGTALATAWTLSATGPKSISGATGSSAVTNAGVDPGSYTLSETGPAGYAASAWTCNDGTNPVPVASGVVTLAINKSYTCTITNNDIAPQLKVTKLLVPTSDFGTFNLTIDGTVFKTAASNNGNTGFVTVNAGTHTVGETIASGTLSNYIATFGGDCAANGSITLAPGDVKQCTITNTRIAKLIIVKNTIGGNATFAFTASSTTSTPLTNFNLTTVSSTATKTFTGLAAGNYSVAETVPTGWTQTSATCSDGSPINAVNLSVGETVTCTFANTKLATLVINKTANLGNGTFQFTSTNATIGNFGLTTVSGSASRTVSNLALGTYDVAETVPAGWRLDSASCSDGSLISAIDLSAGEVVTCTFTNTKLLGNLIIQKVAVGADGGFGFTSANAGVGNFSLTTTAGAASRSFNSIPIGTYAVAETVPTGWQLTSATCSDGSPVTAIDIAENETVTCTFTNTKLGKLIVVKNTLGGDGAFSFTSTSLSTPSFSMTSVGGTVSRTFSNIVPGNHNLAEAAKVGWKLDSSSCSDGSPVTAIDIAPNETVTCTFTNSKLATLTIQKVALGGDRTFSFTSTTLPSTSFTVATVGGTGTKLFSNLLVGTYNVAETVPSGWRLDSATCSDGSPITAVDLSVGENVTCTFNNFKLGKITIIKNSVGGDGIFRFTSLALGNFTLSTVGGTATRNYINLNAGIYDVAELVPAGWTLTSVTCSDGSPASAIDLADHEDVTCTFTNTKP
jgi:Prealbumin-like fold domain